jgi:hypothetical protein
MIFAVSIVMMLRDCFVFQLNTFIVFLLNQEPRISAGVKAKFTFGGSFQAAL